MIQHISFPKIRQFRDTIKYVSSRCEYNQIPLPKFNFEGTIKIHGTNAGVGYNPKTGKLWCQSREQIITPEKDNSGFALFVEQRKGYFTKVLSELSVASETDDIVVVFGEFAGASIQKGVAVSCVEKFFCAFDVYFAKDNENKRSTFCHDWFDNQELRIFNSYMFPVYDIEIDFNDVNASLARLEQLTNDVEQNCPVGEFFGVDGVGEGVVWKSTNPEWELSFKVKGEKHSTSRKLKSGATVVETSPETLASIDEFVRYSVTENRLIQGIQRVFTERGEIPDIKHTGDFLRWVVYDILSEECDVLVASGLTPKQVSGSISHHARKWFHDKCF